MFLAVERRHGRDAVDGRRPQLRAGGQQQLEMRLGAVLDEITRARDDLALP